MELEEARSILAAAEVALTESPYVMAHEFERNGRRLQLVLTSRLVRILRRERMSRSKAVLTALKNAAYGFDRSRARSEAGRDGIYVIDRDYEPRNEMMRKIFDRFLDHSSNESASLAAFLQCAMTDLLAVRLVSHHLRLLGVLHTRGDVDVLALVDFDQSP